LVKLLKQSHYDVILTPTAWQRLYVWLDTYGQRQGSFSAEQEGRLLALRAQLKSLLGPEP
jgi:hypothetical protein